LKASSAAVQLRVLVQAGTAFDREVDQLAGGVFVGEMSFRLDRFS
jgi:hypothetical protein